MGFQMQCFLLVLAVSCISANCRSLETSEVTGKRSEQHGLNGAYCMLCQELASQAMNYFGQNKTQTQIISSLHRGCSRMLMFKTKCLSFVDRLATVVFTEGGIFQPEQLCKMAHLCGNADFTVSDAACDLCHGAAAKMPVKLKHPDTKLELINALLVGCNMGLNSGQEECMKLVIEQVPQMLANLGSFLEGNDVCSSALSCEATQKVMVESAAAA